MIAENKKIKWAFRRTCTNSNLVLYTCVWERDNLHSPHKQKNVCITNDCMVWCGNKRYSNAENSLESHGLCQKWHLLVLSCLFNKRNFIFPWENFWNLIGISKHHFTHYALYLLQYKFSKYLKKMFS